MEGKPNRRDMRKQPRPQRFLNQENNLMATVDNLNGTKRLALRISQGPLGGELLITDMAAARKLSTWLNKAVRHVLHADVDATCILRRRKPIEEMAGKPIAQTPSMTEQTVQ